MECALRTTFNPNDITRVFWWQADGAHVMSSRQYQETSSAQKKLPTSDVFPCFLIRHYAMATDDLNEKREVKYEYTGSCFMYPRKQKRAMLAGHANPDELPLGLLSHFL